MASVTWVAAAITTTTTVASVELTVSHAASLSLA